MADRRHVPTTMRMVLGKKMISKDTTILVNNVPVRLMAKSTLAATRRLAAVMVKSRDKTDACVNTKYFPKHLHVRIQSAVDPHKITRSQVKRAAVKLINRQLRVWGIT